MAGRPNDDAGKRLAFETLFDRGKVRVMFDIRDSGVVLSDAFRNKSSNGKHLCLDYNKLFTGVKTVINERWLSATNMSCDGVPSDTFVPWRSVLAVIQKGVVLESWDPQPVADTSNVNVVESVNTTHDDAKWLMKTVAEG